MSDESDFYQSYVVDAYTFETKWKGQEWMRSVGRWDSPSEAGDKAAEWLQVCADNAMLVEVRLVKVDEINYPNMDGAIP